MLEAGLFFTVKIVTKHTRIKMRPW